jgi:Carboxypeptidase regulatory-like domain
MARNGKHLRQSTTVAIFGADAYVRKPVIRALMLIIAMWAVLMLGAPMATAQLSTATLQGTVTDSTGAVVPGIAIAVRNIETGVVRNTVTGNGGEYLLSALQPGAYELSATHTGFQTVKQINIRLEVGQVATLNFALQIGNLSQTVEVAASGSSIANYDTTLGTVISQQQVVDLPLNGRQFSQLLQLAPGVVPIDNSQNAGKAPNFGAGAASPGVNGQTNRSNLFFLNGMINSNPFFGGFLLAHPLMLFRSSRHNPIQIKLSLVRRREL